jgi:hypothetical protein
MYIINIFIISMPGIYYFYGRKFISNSRPDPVVFYVHIAISDPYFQLCRFYTTDSFKELMVWPYIYLINNVVIHLFNLFFNFKYFYLKILFFWKVEGKKNDQCKKITKLLIRLIIFIQYGGR